MWNGTLGGEDPSVTGETSSFEHRDPLSREKEADVPTELVVEVTERPGRPEVEGPRPVPPNGDDDSTLSFATGNPVLEPGQWYVQLVAATMARLVDRK